MSEGSSWRLLIRRQSSWLPAAAALTTMTYQNRFLAASPRRPKTSPFKSRVLGGPCCSTRRLSPTRKAVSAPRDRTAENQQNRQAWNSCSERDSERDRVSDRPASQVTKTHG